MKVIRKSIYNVKNDTTKNLYEGKKSYVSACRDCNHYCLYCKEL